MKLRRDAIEQAQGYLQEKVESVASTGQRLELRHTGSSGVAAHIHDGSDYVRGAVEEARHGVVFNRYLYQAIAVSRLLGEWSIHNHFRELLITPTKIDIGVVVEYSYDGDRVRSIVGESYGVGTIDIHDARTLDVDGDIDIIDDSNIF